MRPLHKDEPRQMGGHRLVAVLGEGATAQVFLGADPEGRPIVLKAVRPAAARDAAFRARFAREVAAARRLANPYAVPVVDADTAGPVLWIATGYAPGPGLGEAVTRYGPLPTQTVRTLAAGIADALDALHAQGLTHGRLGPYQVALAPDGPRLVDLGVARSPDGPSVTAAGVVLGSVLPEPAFRSPEQLDGRAAGAATDVFSLGSLLVYAATGTGPFGDDAAAGITERVVRGAPRLDDLPPWLRELVSACLVKEPDLRPTPAQIRTATASEQDGPGWLPNELAAEVAVRAATIWTRTGAHALGTSGAVPRPRGGTEAAGRAADDRAPAASDASRHSGAAPVATGEQPPADPPLVGGPGAGTVRHPEVRPSRARRPVRRWGPAAGTGPSEGGPRENTGPKAEQAERTADQPDETESAPGSRDAAASARDAGVWAGWRPRPTPTTDAQTTAAAVRDGSSSGAAGANAGEGSDVDEAGRVSADQVDDERNGVEPGATAENGTSSPGSGAPGSRAGRERRSAQAAEEPPVAAVASGVGGPASGPDAALSSTREVGRAGGAEHDDAHAGGERRTPSAAASGEESSEVGALDSGRGRRHRSARAEGEPATAGGTSGEATNSPNSGPSGPSGTVDSGASSSVGDAGPVRPVGVPRPAAAASAGGTDNAAKPVAAEGASGTVPVAATRGERSGAEQRGTDTAAPRASSAPSTPDVGGSGSRGRRRKVAEPVDDASSFAAGDEFVAGSRGRRRRSGAAAVAPATVFPGDPEDEIIDAELVDPDEPLPPRIAVAPAEAPGRVHGIPPQRSGDAEPSREARRPSPAEAEHAAKAERRRFLAWVAGGAALLAGAATGAVLWGNEGSSGSKVRTAPAAAPPPPLPPVTQLRAWFQSGSYDERQLAALAAELKARRGRTDVVLAPRPPSGYAEALIAALNGADAPDVFEVDLLSLASHHAAGRIADLTPHQARFDGDSWLPALPSAVKVGDKVVGLPLTVSVPTVLFHQGMYAAAGVAAPRSREEWVDGLEALKRRFGANPAFRSLQLPGRSWPVLASFLWEAGGALALREGDTWRGAFDLPGSTDAARFFRQLQQYAPESRDLSEGDLRVGELFARGETASVIGSASLHAAATAVDPQLAQQLGAFAMPSAAQDRPGAVGVRGTALVVSAKCRDVPAAVELLALVASDPWRTRLAQNGQQLTPRSTPEQVVPGPNPMLRAGAAAARAAGRAYPVAPGWSERPVVEFGRAVLGGTDAMAAAVAANQMVAAEFGRTTG